MGIFKGSINGKLLSRLAGEGTLSEGPIYFIIPSGDFAKWKEIEVRKNSELWMKDPVLDDFVGKKITVKGCNHISSLSNLSL